MNVHFGEVHFRGQSVQPDGVQRSQQVASPPQDLGCSFIDRGDSLNEQWERLFRPVRETPEWPCSRIDVDIFLRI
jgi:hypothetical protein